MSGNGFPASAIDRVKDMKGDGTNGPISTSNLSMNELMLVNRTGFDPVGLCLGSCIYHVGFQFAKLSQNQELTVLSQAMYNARGLAMTRMRAEAQAMGADGVIGVRLIAKRMEWDPAVMEFMAVGTGIRHSGGMTGFKGPKDQPFTSNLCGQDFWKLLQTGSRPLEMVMGSCVNHIAHRGFLATLGSVGQNVELTNFTQATYEARENAMQRMQAGARSAGASSVVAVALEESSHSWPPHVTEFFALGTAAIPVPAGFRVAPLSDPQLVLPVHT